MRVWRDFRTALLFAAARGQPARAAGDAAFEALGGMQP
jgi:hypothetical protein